MLSRPRLRRGFERCTLGTAQNVVFNERVVESLDVGDLRHLLERAPVGEMLVVGNNGDSATGAQRDEMLQRQLRFGTT